MRVFISHAEKNSEIVLKFANFLEKASSEIEVFCSSERGSIGVGTNFVKTIFDELSISDIFIPILSNEYFESKFCMIELGTAYSYLCNKYSGQEENYIFPFALYPIKKGQALSGTPISYIQTGDISDESDIHSFLDQLSSQKGLNIGSGVNRKLHSFLSDVTQIILKRQNIVETAKIGAYFDDSIIFKSRDDIANISISNNMIVLNYNMNPYKENKVIYPNFISMVFRYVDKLDFTRYLDVNSQANFAFTLINSTNTLKRIFVEFKFSDSNRILETFEFPLNHGENKLRIPLSNIQSKALSNISEICFVIHPDDVLEEEGMFKIGEMEIQ